MGPRRVSLADELATLADTLEGVQLLAELLATGALPDDEAATKVPEMLEAALALVVGRVRLLRKVVVGSADVALIVGRRNTRDRVAPGEDLDVILGPRTRR